ncbi:coiled-coil domain-containing protein 47 isoform X2 [Zootermopsis nevadensis]|uniref:coiled-coil domain-containing protein 47 isoform X2 n=1 Tax=Zootermopsis nevadensis TaxID=136037 RepID=UPI000B8E94CE|nr:coiled-coil domain-containing protein 47 isoform X2 [Zootermopsis nevadensis]
MIKGPMTMKFGLVLLHIVLVGTQIWASSFYKEDLEDNEFAEFEDFEDEERDYQQVQAQNGRKTEKVQEVNEEQDGEEDDAIVEDDESEFDHFQDEEEFEGFDGERVGSSVRMDERGAPEITITKVPLHFRTDWDSFYLEILMVAGLVVYALNFFAGKSKNRKVANAWFTSHRSLLEENFSLIGDDGTKDNENPGLSKDSESVYTLWCSGRTCCEGMLVELKLLKRQDLVSVMAQFIRPSSDQVHIKVDMNKEDMDSFVFCLATKRSALRLSKDMADLSIYCPERRSVEKYGLPSNFSLLCEIVEVAASLLDSRIVTIINKYADIIEYIHFSDQFSGPKQSEDFNVTKLPDTKKVLIFAFNIPVKGKAIHEAVIQMRPLLQFVFYCMDKVKRFKLSKEAKNKAEKNRLRVEEAFLKTTHFVRAEAAAARREEKKRQEKERILLEDDPDKQKKWEDREMKRQMKKKAPKMKQLKVKAL